MIDKTASEQISDIIKTHNGWKGDMLARLRAVILAADSDIVEEIKWKKPSNPEGLPVWSYSGNVCMVNLLKNAVRLNFTYGAHLKDPTNFFNTRLESSTVRATDFFEGDTVDETALTALVHEAVELNRSKAH